MELDEKTVSLIKVIVKEKAIHTLWFEAHYMYRNKLNDFARQFAPAKVKFRCGIESFDAQLRSSWNKGVADSVTAADVAKHFQGICLLCCTVGDSRKRIIDDIATAKRYFEYFSVNVFCNNGTSVQRDENLVEWFRNEIYPSLAKEDGVEVLLENTDLGVG